MYFTFTFTFFYFIFCCEKQPRIFFLYFPNREKMFCSHAGFCVTLFVICNVCFSLWQENEVFFLPPYRRRRLEWRKIIFPRQISYMEIIQKICHVSIQNFWMLSFVALFPIFLSLIILFCNFYFILSDFSLSLQVNLKVFALGIRIFSPSSFFFCMKFSSFYRETFWFCKRGEITTSKTWLQTFIEFLHVILHFENFLFLTYSTFFLL